MNLSGFGDRIAVASFREKEEKGLFFLVGIGFGSTSCGP
jgi:hypothetical protein